MNCDASELASLGTGFALYYEFFKSLIQMLFILSIFVSTICIVLSVSQFFTPKYISLMKQ
jgi:phage shock protein PspC (stress-responsive transcriptional regulator)